MTVIVSLAELLRVVSKISRKSVRDALMGFTCERDGAVVEDVVDFIHDKAIPFEENRICRTFLAISEPDLSVGVLTVLGYFTLQYIQSKANDESLNALDADLRQVIAANYDSTSGVLLAQSYFKMQKQLYPTRSPILDALITDAGA